MVKGGKDWLYRGAQVEVHEPTGETRRGIVEAVTTDHRGLLRYIVSTLLGRRVYTEADLTPPKDK